MMAALEWHEWFAREAIFWWPAMANHLWQATLFALIVLGACTALTHAPARVRHSFWLLASAKFIVPAAFLVFLAEQANVASLPLFTKTPGGGQSSFFLPPFRSLSH